MVLRNIDWLFLLPLPLTHTFCRLLKQELNPQPRHEPQLETQVHLFFGAWDDASINGATPPGLIA